MKFGETCRPPKQNYQCIRSKLNVRNVINCLFSLLWIRYVSRKTKEITHTQEVAHQKENSIEVMLHPNNFEWPWHIHRYWYIHVDYSPGLFKSDCKPLQNCMLSNEFLDHLSTLEYYCWKFWKVRTLELVETIEECLKPYWIVG